MNEQRLRIIITVFSPPHRIETLHDVPCNNWTAEKRISLILRSRIKIVHEEEEEVNNEKKITHRI